MLMEEIDPKVSARRAGLRYVSDAMPGFNRKKKGKGFDFGKFSEYRPSRKGVRIEPRFAARRVNSPHADGFSVIQPAPDGSEHRVDFGAMFLKSHAQL